MLPVGTAGIGGAGAATVNGQDAGAEQPDALQASAVTV